MAIDPTVDILNQQLRDGNDWEIGGKLNIDTAAGGTLTFDDSKVPLKATLTPSASAANQCTVSLQLADGSGNSATPEIFDIWLSDNASGAGLTATTASGTVAAGASGTDFLTMVAKKALRSQTTAAGLYTLVINDTAKTAFVVCVQLPFGKVVTLTLAAGNYG